MNKEQLLAKFPLTVDTTKVNLLDVDDMDVHDCYGARILKHGLDLKSLKMNEHVENGEVRWGTITGHIIFKDPKELYLIRSTENYNLMTRAIPEEITFTVKKLH